MVHRPQSQITLPRALIGLVIFGILVFATTTFGVVRERVSNFQQAALAQAATVRSQGAAIAFAQSLEHHWHNLLSVANELPNLDDNALSAILNASGGPGREVSWAGFARTNGEVVASSHGMIVGADVSGLPWFQQGLDGPFAGGVREAVLLAPILAPQGGTLPRFLDLSRPIENADGRTIGVLGFYIDADLARGYLDELGHSLGIEIAIVDAGGRIVLATDGSMVEPGLPSIRAAAVGVATSGYEFGADGSRYFSTVLPSVVHGDLPSFGWRMVGRIPEAQYAAATGANVLADAGAIFVLGTLVFLSAGAVFSRVYLSPVGRLAQNADRIANGVDEYPADIRTTSELQRISEALVRLDVQRAA